MPSTMTTTENIEVVVEVIYPLDKINAGANKKLCELIAIKIQQLNGIYALMGEDDCTVRIKEVNIPHRHINYMVPGTTNTATTPTTPPDTIDTPKRVSFTIEDNEEVKPILDKTPKWSK